MILRDLLPATVPLHIRGSLDVEISQLAYDSRLVKPGALFFALPGTKNDGARFIDQACERGACAVVVPPGTVVTGRVTTIFSGTPRLLLGLMADRFYRSPSARLTLIGVTGTSGKTTTTYLLEAIWQALAASPKPQRFAVINADDPWGTVLLTKPIPGRVLTYGLQPEVTVSARNVEKSLRGLRGILRLKEEEVTFSSSLIGEPHLYNILAAAT